MTIAGKDGFQTLSGSLIALPPPGSEQRPVFRFAAGRPDLTAYETVTI
jgi:hypothetical protein